MSTYFTSKLNPVQDTYVDTRLQIPWSPIMSSVSRLQDKADNYQSQYDDKLAGAYVTAHPDLVNDEAAASKHRQTIDAFADEIARANILDPMERADINRRATKILGNPEIQTIRENNEYLSKTRPKNIQDLEKAGRGNPNAQRLYDLALDQHNASGGVTPFRPGVRAYTDRNKVANTALNNLKADNLDFQQMAVPLGRGQTGQAFRTIKGLTEDRAVGAVLGSFISNPNIMQDLQEEFMLSGRPASEWQKFLVEEASLVGKPAAYSNVSMSGVTKPTIHAPKEQQQTQRAVKSYETDPTIFFPNSPIAEVKVYGDDGTGKKLQVTGSGLPEAARDAYDGIFNPNETWQEKTIRKSHGAITQPQMDEILSNFKYDDGSGPRILTDAEQKNSAVGGKAFMQYQSTIINPKKDPRRSTYLTEGSKGKALLQQIDFDLKRNLQSRTLIALDGSNEVIQGSNQAAMMKIIGKNGVLNKNLIETSGRYTADAGISEIARRTGQLSEAEAAKFRGAIAVTINGKRYAVTDNESKLHTYGDQEGIKQYNQAGIADTRYRHSMEHSVGMIHPDTGKVYEYKVMFDFRQKLYQITNVATGEVQYLKEDNLHNYLDAL